MRLDFVVKKTNQIYIPKAVVNEIGRELTGVVNSKILLLFPKEWEKEKVLQALKSLRLELKQALEDENESR